MGPANTYLGTTKAVRVSKERERSYTYYRAKKGRTTNDSLDGKDRAVCLDSSFLCTIVLGQRMSFLVHDPPPEKREACDGNHAMFHGWSLGISGSAAL